MTHHPEGVGCRRYVAAAAALLGFAALAVASGVALVLEPACTGICEDAGLALYAAGGPVSGLFSVLAGGLPIAWPVDIILWVVVAFAVTSLAERLHRRWWHGALAAMGGAVGYGAIASLFIERA